MSVLEVRDARKSFGKVEALRGVSLELRAGELLALLGPNGAGKTTLVRAIAGRVRLDAGEIELLGERIGAGGAGAGAATASDAAGGGARTPRAAATAHAPRAAYGRMPLGIVPQEIAVYPLLTARENLEVFGQLHGVSGADLKTRVAWALEWTGLAERTEEPVKRFSGGMRRRLNIACGVLHEPRVILLDEPTVGVDPQSRERIFEMLDVLRRGGASLLLTTHQLDEAEARCDRIIVIDHGEVIATGTLAELVEKTVGSRRSVTVSVDRAPSAPIAGLAAESAGGADAPGAAGVVVGAASGATRLRAQVADVGAELPALLARVQAAGCRVGDVEVRAPSLQAVFIHLTGRDLRE